MEVCQQQALSAGNPFFIDRERCIQCGKCAAVCPTQALEMKGKRMTVSDVIRELQKRKTYFGAPAAELPSQAVSRWRSRCLRASS